MPFPNCKASPLKACAKSRNRACSKTKGTACRPIPVTSVAPYSPNYKKKYLPPVDTNKSADEPSLVSCPRATSLRHRRAKYPQPLMSNITEYEGSRAEMEERNSASYPPVTTCKLSRRARSRVISPLSLFRVARKERKKHSSASFSHFNG